MKNRACLMFFFVAQKTPKPTRSYQLWKDMIVTLASGPEQGQSICQATLPAGSALGSFFFFLTKREGVVSAEKLRNCCCSVSFSSFKSFWALLIKRPFGISFGFFEVSGRQLQKERTSEKDANLKR